MTNVQLARNTWVPAAAAPIASVVALVLLTAAAAQVTVPIPGSPVPMTLQTLPVLLAPVVLGARLGMIGMIAYVALGGMGVPVFAGAEGGVRYVFGATGGYLLGFIVAQPLIAALLNPQERPDRGRGSLSDWRGLIAALVAAHMIIWGLGAAWLKLVSGVSWGETLAMGVWPFLPGDLIKAAMAVVAGMALLRMKR